MGAAVCSPCAAGRAANLVGATGCDDCLPGHFTLLGGSCLRDEVWRWQGTK